MATPFMWRACSLSEKFYKYFLRYPARFALDESQQKFRVEKSPQKLAWFYLPFVPLVFYLLLSLVIVAGYVFISAFVALYLALLNFVVVAFLVMCITLSVVFHRYEE